MWPLLVLLPLTAPAPAADPPRVAVVYSSFRDGSYAYRDEYDRDLGRLGWPVTKFENTQTGDLASHLGDFDLLIGAAVFNFEHPQDFAAHGSRLAAFVRYGGILLLTDMNYASQVDWLPSLGPGLKLSVAGESCPQDGEPARWLDVRHPLLAGVPRVPSVWCHPVEASGLWTILARCEDGRPLLMVRELGDGLIVASCIYRQYGFPDWVFLQNLWRWARDEGRIEAARDREYALAKAIAAPKELEAKRLDQPPVIDGIVEEDSWNQAARTAPFVTNDNRGPANQSTTALIGLDDYYLYVAFLAADSAPDGLVTKASERDGAVYHDDCVEFFVDPTGRRESYRHFIVNAAGVLYDEATIDPAWDGWWQAKAQRSPRGWTAELRVPLLMLGDPAGFAEEWALNFNRYYPRTGELSAWSPTFGPFAAPQRFGLLRKARVDPKRFALRLNRATFSEGRLSLSFGNPEEGEFAGSYVVECLGPVGRRTQTTRELRIPGEGNVTLETRHLLETPGTYILRPRVETVGPVWFGEAIRHVVPPWLSVSLPDHAYRNGLFAAWPPSRDLRLVAGVREPREGMTVEATVAGSGVDEKRRVAVAGRGPVELSIPHEEWPPGSYALTVRLLAGRRELQREQRTLQLHRPAPGSEVTFDAEGICYLNGRPFLPLGLYHVAEPVAQFISQQNAAAGLPPLTLEAMLDGVQAQGFNCFVRGWGMPGRAFLDLARERGLYVMPEIGGFAEEDLRKTVREGRDHPALLMWYGVDEPSGDRLQHSLSTRRLYLEEDPYHPVGAALNNPGVFAEAGQALDVLMTDPYPIDRAPIAMVSSFCDGAERVRRPGQALWAVPQAFAVHGVWREPTPEELRNMTYQALVSGARGLVWYAYYTTEANEAFGMPRNPKRKQWYYPETPLWEYHGRLNQELRALQDVILTSGGTPLGASHESVRALLRLAPSRSVILAVNTDRTDHRATITLPPGAADAEAQVLGEDRTVPLRNGELTDTFEGIAVHVYEW